MKEVEKVKASVDIKLSKDDIFNVVVSEKEASIEDSIKIEKKTLRILEGTRFDLGEKLRNLLSEEYKVSNVSFSYSFLREVKYNKYQIYDIEELVKLKRPQLSTRQFVSKKAHLKNVEKDSQVVLKKEFEKDGFKGTLTKELLIKDISEAILRKMESLCQKHFEFENAYYTQKKLVKELEYDLLTLDNTHRKIKAEIAKKFIPSKDLKNLLTLKK